MHLEIPQARYSRPHELLRPKIQNVRTGLAVQRAKLGKMAVPADNLQLQRPLCAPRQQPGNLEWEIGDDGHPLRTEHGLQLALGRRGLERNPSNPFGQNNCLIDRLISGLCHRGYVRMDINSEERRAACAAARWHLMQEHGLAAGGCLFIYNTLSMLHQRLISCVLNVLCYGQMRHPQDRWS